MELWRRITLLAIGLVEAVLFSGIVFGWANLLYILQEEGVYSHLCDIPLKTYKQNISTQFERISPTNASIFGDKEAMTQEPLLMDELDEGTPVMKCALQANRFTLIYTVAATMYGLTSVFIGFSLDHFGLWATRISGSVMTVVGFFCLVFTSKEIPWLLWPALNLVALGTNQLKLCVFQFTNLWPARKSTILFAYGAGFSISATIFTPLQYIYDLGVSYKCIILPLACLSVLTLPVTFLMPMMHVKEHVDKEDNEEGKGKSKGKSSKEILPLNRDCDEIRKNNVDEKPLNGSAKPNMVEKEILKSPEIPLSSSILTISALLHLFWHFVNMFMILFYSLSFNAWVYKATDDSREVAHYTQIMGICQLIGPLFTPVTGLFTDLRINKAQQHSDPVTKLATTIQAPAFGTMTATIFLMALMTCKLFVTKPAIYSSMFLVAICRPLVHSSCVSYVRLRFPAEHFNRLYGIFTTTVAAVMFVQYPIFIWMFSSDNNYQTASVALMVGLLISLVSPGHMFMQKVARFYAQRQITLIESRKKVSLTQGEI